ncbi:MAG: hypothetical protein QN122_03965 [Armatimonadota bacterium]|nr:hypothetical protein [Armatimonadota bacterium]MDR7449787.1 hypothetical protein [Armatimonadota bacterium]MDR7458424.1 hypothetical protein [Armatimonadota bacterium]MDR7478774.1 hypothetical protein [Armatimonadota bacterium]MDR7488232.1 hypothetical protein [Armatimonadota bacterium]
MEQVLILARGFDIPQATRAQVSSMRAALEQLSRDPRVKQVFGLTGYSTGFAIWSEVSNPAEAERLSSLCRVYGLTNVEIFPLVNSEHLRIGLEEAERVSVTVPREVPAPTPAHAGT